MFRVAELAQTCLASPSQWEGRTEDDRPFYVRYRWGTLTVQLGEPGTADAVEGELLFKADVGDKLGGWMDWSEVEKATGIRMAAKS